jgi:hypothetical protein
MVRVAAPADAVCVRWEQETVSASALVQRAHDVFKTTSAPQDPVAVCLLSEIHASTSIALRGAYTSVAGHDFI